MWSQTRAGSLQTVSPGLHWSRAEENTRERAVPCSSLRGQGGGQVCSSSSCADRVSWPHNCEPTFAADAPRPPPMCIRAPVLVRGSFLWYCRGSSGYVVRFLNGTTELGEQPQKRVFWILEGLWLRHAPPALGRCGRHSIGGAGMRISVCTREPGLVQQPAGSVREASPRSTSAGWMLSSLPSVHLSTVLSCA